MMKRIISFGTYTFPDSIPSSGEILRTNFGDAVPRTTRLPGLDGGFDNMGDAPAPNEIGFVRARLTLVASSAADMAARRDAVMAMMRAGRATLTAETFAGAMRYCMAKVNNINLPAVYDARSARIIDATVDFQVAYPRWYSAAAGSPVGISASGTLTDGTVTASGTAVAQPVITVTATTAISAGGLTIRRMVSSVVADEIVYAAALANADVLAINCQGLTVRKNGTDAYGAAFSAAHPAWLRLQPGANTIRVILGGGETATVSVAWEDTWY
jgi:hypothetical protein